MAAALHAVAIDPVLILTGQHPALDPADYGMSLHAVHRLGCRAGDEPHDYARRVAKALTPTIARADLVVVQGDTSSALGGALAAVAAGVPLAHVEAGLRTHDPNLPWPEEQFRVAIDAHADLLFAPTNFNAANLHAEQVGGTIHVTGNTGIDAVLTVAAALRPTAKSEKPRLLVTCHRRESWGDGLRGIAAALIELASDRIAIDVLLHPNPQAARPMRQLLSGITGITLKPPCGHRELLQAMRAATLVLSDSGGIQEEAPALGGPLLVLRDKTERPEAIATGNMLMVGTDSARIVAEVRRLLADRATLVAMTRPALPYGDGRSGPRIAAIIAQWLEDGEELRQSA